MHPAAQNLFELGAGARAGTHGKRGYPPSPVMRSKMLQNQTNV
jgi:hypothetical protein